MNTTQKQLRISQLDHKMSQLARIKDLPLIGGGWIHSIRTALGMSLKQLGNRLGITPQGAKDIERREKEGSITLQRLKEVAVALDMQLVYGLVPKEQSLERMIEKRARQLAKEIVMRTAHTMLLEDQEVGKDVLSKAIEARTQQIKYELPKCLWD